MRIFEFQLKKLLIILLMFVYGFSASGMTVQFHYCCGKFKNVDWTPVKRSGCGNEHKMGSKPCCETKQVIANASDHFNFLEEAKSLKFCDAIIESQYVGIRQCPVRITITVAHIQSPPSIDFPLYIQHCVFRL